jgi:hypothetical protein
MDRASRVASSLAVWLCLAAALPASRAHGSEAATRTSPVKPAGLRKAHVALSHPEQIRAFAERELATRDHRLAIGGFFKAPTRAHYQLAQKFVEQLVHALGPKSVALITSPSTDVFPDGTASPDYMTTTTAHATGAKAFYVGTPKFASNADARTIANRVSRRIYARSPKHILESEDDYGQAEMIASNALVLTGGRLASVSDFVKTIRVGNKAVLMVNRALGELSFDANDRRPSDATAYLSVMLETADRLERTGRDLTKASSYPWPFMPERGFTPEFVAKHLAALRRNVLSVEVSSPSDVARAVERVKAHLRMPSMKLEREARSAN